MKVSDNIVSLRRYHDLTQKELSDRTGINQSVLSRIENGTRPVRDEELKIFADFFNVSADYLLGRESSVLPPSNVQSTLLNDFEELNEDGRQAILFMLGSLKKSHPKQIKNSGIVQANIGNGNVLTVGNNNRYKF